MSCSFTIDNSESDRLLWLIDGDYLDMPLSTTTRFVTPSAVSVVIWTLPRWRVGKPSFRRSAVRSRGGSSPAVAYNKYELLEAIMSRTTVHRIRIQAFKVC